MILPLALDQAPSFIGFAYGEIGGVPVRGCHENPDYGNNEVPLIMHVRDWLTNLVKSSGATHLFHEQIIVRKYGLHLPTLHKQFAIVAAIQVVAGDLGLSSEYVMIDEWRDEFYSGARPPKGAGSESKVWKEMAVVECARRNWYVEDHNAAEACGLWDFGCKTLDFAYHQRSKIARRRAELAADEARRAGL